jgi:hypothetical protein
MEQQTQTQEKPILGNGVFHPSARPMQFIVDKNWLYLGMR